MYVSYCEWFQRCGYFTVQEFEFGTQYCLSLPPYCATVRSMWMGMKLQVAVVAVESDNRSSGDIVGVLFKLLHIFTNAEYVDML